MVTSGVSFLLFAFSNQFLTGKIFINVTSGIWSMEKTGLIFDLFALAEDYSLPYAFEFNCVNKPTGIRYYDEFKDPEWNLFSSGTYYYSNNIINKVNPLFQSKVTPEFDS